MKNISNRFNILKIRVPKAILYLAILSSVLSLLRAIIWGKLSFLYILWNLLLAIIPFLFSLIMLELHKKHDLKIPVFIVGFVLWLLFIPNAPYLVTDFIHLGESRVVPVIFDTVLLFSAAFFGMVLFFFSLSHIEELIRSFLPKKWTVAVVLSLIILISFGIYLGRFLRFNSWDVFVNHYSLIKNVWKIFSYEAGAGSKVYLFTLMYSFFLFFSYKAWKSIISDAK